MGSSLLMAACLTYIALVHLFSTHAVPIVDPDECFQIHNKTNSSVTFIADSGNRCMFWHCTRRGRAVLKNCAPGTRLASFYLAESTNPCVEHDRERTPESCLRKETTTETLQTSWPTIFPSISQPEEELSGRLRTHPPLPLRTLIGDALTPASPGDVTTPPSNT